MGWFSSLTSRSPRNPRLSDAGPHGSRSRLHLHTAYCPASARLTCPAHLPFLQPTQLRPAGHTRSSDPEPRHNP